MRVLTDEAGGRSVGALAYFPDGSRLAAVATPPGAKVNRTHVARLEVWDLATNAIAAEERLGSGTGRCVAVSPDGSEVAAGNGNWQIFVCDAAARRPPHALQSPGGTVVTLAFSPDGSQLVSGAADRGNLSKIGNLSSWRRPDYDREFLRSSACYGLAYPADGRFLARADGAGDVVITAPDGVHKSQRHHTGRFLVRAMDVSPDGHYVAAAVGGRIWVCERRDGDSRMIGRQGKPYNDVTFSPDGATVITGGSDGVIRLWEVGTWVERAAFEWGFANVQCVAFSPDGMTCAAGGRGDVSLVIWDVE